MEGKEEEYAIITEEMRSTILNYDTIDTANGYVFETCQKPSEEFNCPLCSALMKDCVEISCGHIMCRDCLSRWEEERKTKQQSPVCPKCETAYDQSKTFPNKAVDHLITTSISVKCKNKKAGCAWTGNILQSEDHLKKNCKYEIVKCTNTGCTEKIDRMSMKKHKPKCVYRSVSCIFCKKYIIRHTLEEHLKCCNSASINASQDIDSQPNMDMEVPGRIEHADGKVTNGDNNNQENTETKIKNKSSSIRWKSVKEKVSVEEKLRKVLKELSEELKILKQQRSQTDQKFREIETTLQSHEERCDASARMHNDRLYFRISALDVHSQFCSITERRMKQSISEDELRGYESDIRNELIQLELKGEKESDALKQLFLEFHMKYDTAVQYQKPCELFKIQDLLMLVDMLNSYRSKYGNDEAKGRIINKVMTLLMNENGDVPWFYQTFMKYYYDIKF